MKSALKRPKRISSLKTQAEKDVILEAIGYSCRNGRVKILPRPYGRISKIIEKSKG